MIINYTNFIAAISFVSLPRKITKRVKVPPSPGGHPHHLAPTSAAPGCRSCN